MRTVVRKPPVQINAASYNARMMKHGEAFKYEDPREILVTIFENKKNRNPLFSIRAWSKKLGFRNPSLLSDVLNGKRRVTPEFGLKISDMLDLSADEKKYFQALIYHENAKDDEERAFFAEVMARFKPETDSRVVSPADISEAMTHWTAGVVDELPLLADYREDYNYLAKRLGPDISPQVLERMTKIFLRAGLLVRDSKGRLTKPKVNFIGSLAGKVSSDREIQLLRALKRIYMEKAITAIDAQSSDECHFRHNSFPMRAKDLPRVKAKIDEFIKELYGTEALKKDAEEIYFLELQFYRVTQPINEGTSHADSKNP